LENLSDGKDVYRARGNMKRISKPKLKGAEVCKNFKTAKTMV